MGIRTPQRDTDERGASLVEFAVLAPLLLILVLGIVEFGWLFGQNNSVRHAAGEAARVASVNGGSSVSSSDIAQVACNDLLGSGGITSLQVSVTSNPPAGDIGAAGSVTVEVGVQSLSNAPIISSFVPSTLNETAIFRLEQPKTWGNEQVTLDPSDCSVISVVSI